MNQKYPRDPHKIASPKEKNEAFLRWVAKADEESRRRQAAEVTLKSRADEARLSKHDAKIARGEVVASKGKGQTVEIKAESVEVVGWVDDPETYPMQAKRHSMEHLRKVAHLRPRTNKFSATLRVRNSLAFATHEFFNKSGFYYMHSPLITASDCEGAGEMFQVRPP